MIFIGESVFRTSCVPSVEQSSTKMISKLRFNGFQSIDEFLMERPAFFSSLKTGTTTEMASVGHYDILLDSS